MLCDAREIEDRKVLRSAICIIGGGTAGITMALEFERRGIDTILLESGGVEPDSGTMDLHRGENIGIPYQFGDGFRNRFLGGDSNGWGGWCRPFDPEDFRRRDWVSDSGWPFGLDDLMPYYERAHPVLGLGPVNYDMDFWVKAINRRDVRRMRLPGGKVLDGVSQFSPPMRFGKSYRKTLKNAKHVRVFLHANVVDIETERSGQTVLRVHTQTLSGRRMAVEAREFVLAAGGIENARVLLASNKTHRSGLGNYNDLVGRYFMDHPRLKLGKITLREPWRRNKLYDAMFHYQNRVVAAQGTRIAAQMTISPEVQRDEGLLNGRIWLMSIFPGEGTAAADAIVRMKFRLHGKVDPHHSFLGDLSSMVREPLNAANFIAALQLQPVGLVKAMHFHMIKEARFQMICEPKPDPDSRVMLSESRDRLGMPRVRVEWRLGDQVKHTFDRPVAIVAKELESAGIADVKLDPPLMGREWPTSLEGTWHYMGTTRMHDSPKQGVVDRNSRIHGVANMFVAGSSVFPSAGANFPTITLVALALRLSDHIAKRLETPDAAVCSPARLVSHELVCSFAARQRSEGVA